MAKKEAKTNAMRILDTKHIPYRVLQYPCDEFTDALEIADQLNEPYEKVYKTLVTVGNDRQNYVFVIPVAKELDLKKAARAVGVKSLEMLHVKDLLATTGYIRGGCTAIGMKKQFPTCLDQQALSLPEMLVSGGRRGTQIALTPADYISASAAQPADLCKDGYPIISSTGRQR